MHRLARFLHMQAFVYQIIEGCGNLLIFFSPAPAHLRLLFTHLPPSDTLHNVMLVSLTACLV